MKEQISEKDLAVLEIERLEKEFQIMAEQDPDDGEYYLQSQKIRRELSKIYKKFPELDTDN